jgi:hypothetical protein
LIGRSLLIAACVALASCHSATSSLAGMWSLCASDSLSRSVCGTIEVGRTQKEAFNYRTYQPVEYHLDLAPLLGPHWTPRPECGSLLTDNEARVTLMLGIECGAVLSYDSGNLIAERLISAGDSIFGSWSQSCIRSVVNCPAHGRIVLRRSSNRAA